MYAVDRGKTYSAFFAFSMSRVFRRPAESAIIHVHRWTILVVE